jgi:O-antigen/teichoic acid export membrane protein
LKTPFDARQEQAPEQRELPIQRAALLGIFGRNSLWLWTDRGLLSIGTLVAGLLLVRHLGPGDYGLYSLALSIGGITSTLFDLGITRYAARAVAANLKEGPAILAAGIALCTIFFAGIIFALIVVTLRQDWVAECICVGLLIGNLQRLATIAAFFLTAELRSGAILSGSIVYRLGAILVMGIVILNHLSVLPLLVGLAGISVPVVGIRLWQLHHHWPTRRDWKWKSLFYTVRQAWPFMSYSWTETGYAQISVLSLGLVASRQAVGWFAAALTIANVFPQWVFASCDALLPVMTRLFETQRMDVILEMRERLLDVLLIAAVPVAVALSTFAPQICALLGPRFASSSPVLQILAGNAVLSAIGGLLGGAVLMAINRVSARRNALATTLLPLAGLTLLLGWVWGPKGAGAALLAADAALLVQYLQIFSANGLTLRFGRTAWISMLGGAAMGGFSLSVIRFIGWPLTLLLGVLVYLGTFVLFAPHRLTSAGRTLRECVTGA